MSTADANPPAAGQAPDQAPFFEASWVAAVRGAADRLDGELGRAPAGNSPADHRIASAAIGRARALAERRYLPLNGGDTWRARWIGRPWRLAGAWWTGGDVDQAWAALHTAGQALLCVEDVGVVRSQLGDIHYAQYLFTRLVDQQAKSLLTSAGSRNDPAITPQVPPGAKPPNLSTTAVAKGRP